MTFLRASDRVATAGYSFIRMCAKGWMIFVRPEGSGGYVEHGFEAQEADAMRFARKAGNRLRRMRARA